MAPSARDSTREPVSTQRIASLLTEFHSLVPGARERAISTLMVLDRKAAIRELRRLLKGRDPEMRCDAAEALLRIDASRTIDFVLPLLTDPDSAVRWNTCGLLHDFGDQRGIPPLVHVLLNDPEADVRYMASYALGEIGDRSALSALQQASRRDSGADADGRPVCDMAAAAIQSISAREG